jgi:hypothetical protein
MPDMRLPAELRARVARSLVPVRPLPAPGRRALTFLGLGVGLLAGVPLMWGVRQNAAELGGTLWALSLLQVGAAVLLLRRALVESIPGRLGDRGRVLAWGALGLALTLGVTAVTFVASPTDVPPRWAGEYLYICSTRTFALGLPALTAAGFLLRRGLVARPMLVGALAGLGSGLLADSAWRVYCEVSDPWHVLTAHTSGVLALCVFGALAGAFVRLAARHLHRWIDGRRIGS